MIGVSGAGGFVGRHLMALVEERGIPAIGITRRPAGMRNCVAVGDFHKLVELPGALCGARAIIHLAGRAHSPVGDEDRANYVRDNIDAGRHMLDAAAARGVGRFVFVSSVKVNGEETRTQPFRADDRPAPQDVYGQTKWETERNLSERAEQLGIELVVVRPPLVYGPGVKGNFARLIRWVQRGVPLPFGRIENHRSLVSVFNLCDLLIRCTEHPDAAGRTFMVSDGDDVSTPELVRRLASALGRRDRLVPISPRLLWLVARTSRQEGVYRRLCGSLQVDITATRRLLAWEPPVPLGEGVRRTVAEVAR